MKKDSLRKQTVGMRANVSKILFPSINGFDTDEVAVLDSTDTVDEYTTDCGVMVIKEMMEELD